MRVCFSRSPSSFQTAAVPACCYRPLHRATVATGIRGGYQVVAADMNHDGKVDLIGLGQSADQLFWYENPSSDASSHCFRSLT